jgi:hypothetical protein
MLNSCVDGIIKFYHWQALGLAFNCPRETFPLPKQESRESMTKLITIINHPRKYLFSVD